MKGWLLLLAAVTAPAQTFYKDIAPIVYEYCAPCHRPGEAAPFPLLTAEDAKKRAKQIAAVTASRYMPPWPPANTGVFTGERRLTAAQIRTIAAWAAAGAPAGESKGAMPLPKFTEGWQMGPPDLVVTIERPYTLAASGSDVFRNFVLRLPLDRTRYVKAVEIRPGNKRIVHHANLLVDRAATSRSRDGEDGAPGFPGMDVRIETQTFDPDSHFLFWKPGTVASEEPADMAWRIDPGTDLILNMHLQPGGKPEELKPSVGLYFTDRAPARLPMLVQLEHDGALDIPAGKRDFAVTDRLVLPVDSEILGIYPHAHYIGKDVEAWATLPNGTRRQLIHIPAWDINWQAVYRYRQPVKLPKGSVVEMRWIYDNSGPKAVRVVNGDRSTDEMAHVWLQVLPQGADGRMAVQEAVLRRRLEKYPRDFFAQYSLGAMLQARGRLDEAMGLYRKAIEADGRSATAHNALGTALQQAGRVAESVGEFEQALRLRPEYGDAHYNLSRTLLAMERFPEAIGHLREAVRLDGRDAAALSNLGAALVSVGQADEGMRYLREAVRVRPDYFEGRYNLGQALAAAGQLAEAAGEFRAAVALRPGDADAREGLKAVEGRR